jgi:hypothetical protein
LRERADAGDRRTKDQLVELLADQGDLNGIELEVLRGNRAARRRIIDLVAARNPAAAERLRRNGLNLDGGTL